MYTPNCCTDNHMQITRYYNSRSTSANDWHSSNILIYKKHNMFTCPCVRHRYAVRRYANKHPRLKLINILTARCHYVLTYMYTACNRSTFKRKESKPKWQNENCSRDNRHHTRTPHSTQVDTAVLEPWCALCQCLLPIAQHYIMWCNQYIVWVYLLHFIAWYHDSYVASPQTMVNIQMTIMILLYFTIYF